MATLDRSGPRADAARAVMERYREAICRELGGGLEVSFFWKGRVALYAILKALGVGQGDEVVVPGFTCVVVPNAVLYTGATPVYADVDPRVYTVTRETIQPLLSSRTRAIVTQNTFGLSADLDPILELAAERGITVIDDCAHGFGGTYKQRPNGTLTRVSLFSTQWNKPFSTAIGGFSVTRDKDLGAGIAQYEANARPPSPGEVMMLRAMWIARRHLLTGASYWPLVNLYRWLSAKNAIIGSSQGRELTTTEEPEGFLKGLSAFQAAVGRAALRDFPASRSRRQALAVEYDELLDSLGKTTPARPGYAGHFFLKYPVRVRRREMVLRKGRERRVRLGDWFLSPLHPMQGDLSAWGYRAGDCPNADALAGQTLNLPTDPDVGRRELQRIKRFVADNRDEFL